MASIVLQITIPDAKVAKAAEGFLELYPNTELVNPEDLESGLKYSTKNWVEERIMRTFKRDVHRGLRAKATRLAQADVVADDAIATRED